MSSHENSIQNSLHLNEVKKKQKTTTLVVKSLPVTHLGAVKHGPMEAEQVFIHLKHCLIPLGLHVALPSHRCANNKLPASTDPQPNPLI